VLDIFINTLVIIFACIGIFFFLVGTLGLIRLPDVYTRLHAGTKCDTLGAGSILFALAIYERFSINGLKMVVLAFLVMVASSTTGHAISRAAYKIGIMPWRKKVLDVFPEEESENVTES